MRRLLLKARALINDSTAPEANGFDAAAWLKRWVEIPQPALGGRKPAELIGSVEGEAAVVRVLEAIASGAYQ